MSEETMTHQLDTAAVHAGREDLTALGLHVPSIDLSTTYPLPDLDAGGHAYEVLATGQRPEAGAASGCFGVTRSSTWVAHGPAALTSTRAWQLRAWPSTA